MCFNKFKTAQVKYSWYKYVRSSLSMPGEFLGQRSLLSYSLYGQSQVWLKWLSIHDTSVRELSVKFLSNFFQSFCNFLHIPKNLLIFF